MLTEIELTVMQAFADLATPGPWHIEPDTESGTQMIIAPQGPIASTADLYFGSGGTVQQGIEDDAEVEANADFIAAARTFIPEAIAEIRRLSAPSPALIEQTTKAPAVGYTKSDIQEIYKTLSQLEQEGGTFKPYQLKHKIRQIRGYIMATEKIYPVAAPTKETKKGGEGE